MGRMSDDEGEVQIPKDEQAVIDMLEGERGEKLSEQEQNLAIAQAKLIGDI